MLLDLENLFVSGLRRILKGLVAIEAVASTDMRVSLF